MTEIKLQRRFAPVRRELRKVVKLLEKNYDRGLNSDFARDPVAWALYRTWKEIDGGAKKVRFIKGRLKFGGCKNAAPFPSMVVVFKREVSK